MTVTSSVSQGSVLGPILFFIAYSLEVINIVEHHGLRAHAFADDLQVYGHVVQDDASSLVVRMVACIKHQTWMTSNCLRLNPSKTELIWLGSSRHLHHCPTDKVRISNADIQPAESIRDLGVLIDSAVTLTTHVNHLVGICFSQLRQIRIIHRSLTTDAARSLVRALIHAHIDYCNGLLASCLKYSTDKLQSVLRTAARLVLLLPYRSSVTDFMHRQLHWLDIQSRVRYKIGPARVQVPPRVGSPIPLWLLRPGASSVHSLLPVFSPVAGASSHCPSNENEDNPPSRLLPCFARRLELAPWRFDDLNSPLAVLGTNWKLSFSPKFNASHFLIFVVCLLLFYFLFNFIHSLPCAPTWYFI